MGEWPEAEGARVVLIAADTMGRGPEELGRILVRSFLHTLTEVEPCPQVLIFLNSGVRLVTEGSPVLDDLRGRTDAHGRPLVATVTAVADEVAAASELVRGKVAGRPVAVVRGLGRYVTDDDGAGARALVRPAADDLFREGSAEAEERGYRRGLAEARGEEPPAG